MLPNIRQILSFSLAVMTVIGAQSGDTIRAADALNFRIIGAPDTRPSGAGRSSPPSAPGGFPDFQILGTPSVQSRLAGSEATEEWEASAQRLDFTVLGAPLPMSALKPVIYVYSAPPGIFCFPCSQLARQSGELPYTLEWRKPPAWVQAYPTLHWQAANGGWKKCEGWPGAAMFRKIYDLSQEEQETPNSQ